VTQSEGREGGRQGKNSRGPLHGLVILDMTSVVMGPSCTQALGDMGANVIKVESPEGDTTRWAGPSRHPGMGALFLNANRSKRSIVLDLKKEDGRNALLRLASRADVLIYNVRPQAMARLGLDWETIHAVNPRLIYAGVFGYGQDGAYAALPAYDDLIQGASGMAALFHRSTGEAPRYVPSAIADRVTGLSAVGVILAAVIERQTSGLGQRVDVPMFETMVSFVLADHLSGLTFEPPIGAGGYARQLSPQRRPYRTRDGFISALVYSDRQWQSFLRIVGRERDFFEDPRYRDVSTRLAHIDALYGEVEEALRARDTAEWLLVLRQADIPAMPVHDLDTIFQDPHLKEAGLFSLTNHPTEGEIRELRCSHSWSRTQPESHRPAPRHGEHSIEVLVEAGFGEDEIAALQTSAALVQLGVGAAELRNASRTVEAKQSTCSSIWLRSGSA